jgi:SAM-dependent methyltransferase
MPTLTPVPRKCAVCGTNDSAVLFAQAHIDEAKLDGFAFASRKNPEYMHWTLWHCRACDLVFANPAPPIEQLASLYKAASFGSAAEARFASRTYGRVLRKIARRLPDRAAALDIGTGDGAFLHELLDAGFTDVVGIEPSTAPIKVADPRVRGLIQQGLFVPGILPANRFSLVTCFQTIEHLPDPLSAVREAWRILKPGGAFFVVGHNWRSLSAKLLGRRNPMFDIEHLQLFSRTSLSRLMSRAGFGGVQVRTLLNVYPISYWARPLPMPERLKRRLTEILKVTGIGRMPVPLPAGNMWAVGYKSKR